MKTLYNFDNSPLFNLMVNIIDDCPGGDRAIEVIVFGKKVMIWNDGTISISDMEEK
jgi:hypothetical protein